MLIGDDPQITDHPKIKKANDPFIPFVQLELDLNNLKNLLDKNRVKEVKQFLEKLIKSYKSNSKIVDHLYIERLLLNKYQKNKSFNKNDNDKNDKVIKLSKQL